jgi:hypothetical protein
MRPHLTDDESDENKLQKAVSNIDMKEVTEEYIDSFKAQTLYI